jgi:hypothetical protein
MFVSNSKKLEKLFFLYSDIDIELSIEDKNIPINCRIMRKFKDGDNVFYGIIFLSIEDKDFEQLFYLLYGREIKDDDLEKWEGGSEPPKAEF